MSNENITFSFTEQIQAEQEQAGPTEQAFPTVQIQAEQEQAEQEQAEQEQAEQEQAEQIQAEQIQNEIYIAASIDLELADYYSQTYNVKKLNQILQYYNISKHKMLKDELIQVIVFYETDPMNNEIVQRRMRLWRNIEELRADPFFKPFILPF
jgi:hypothetical protein